MKFAVTVLSPAGYPHSAAVAEIAETLHHALRRLGHDSVLGTDPGLAGRRHIVLGSNLLPHYPQPLPSDAILYNLEQVSPGSQWFQFGLIEIFRRHTLWDYSERNAAALAALGVKVARVVPIGYVPELTRIAPAPYQDIDVFFAGSLNTRRRQLLDRIAGLGLKIGGGFGLYGAQRDALVARAKLVLNAHYFEAKVLEMVRISYMLANRLAVLSERGADPAEDAALAEGVAFADYDDLPRRARELVDAPSERFRLAQRGFELIRERPAVEYLRAALEDA
jgi:hypothetical protein